MIHHQVQSIFTLHYNHSSDLNTKYFFFLFTHRRTTWMHCTCNEWMEKEEVGEKKSSFHFNFILSLIFHRRIGWFFLFFLHFILYHLHRLVGNWITWCCDGYCTITKILIHLIYAARVEYVCVTRALHHMLNAPSICTRLISQRYASIVYVVG